MASFVYNKAKEEIMDGTIDLINDAAIKVMLIDNTGTFVADPDDLLVDDGTSTDATSNELSGTGYTAGFGNSGRKALTSEVIAADNTNDRAEFDAANLTWSSLNAGAIQCALIIKEITNDAGSRLIAHIDTGGFPLTSNGGDVVLAWNAEGIIQF